MEWIFEIPKYKITYNTLLVDIKDFIYMYIRYVPRHQRGIQFDFQLLCMQL
jgi:hypothetical protein